MNSKTSRRDFLSAGLSAGLTLPVMGAGSRMGLWPPSGESTAKTAGSQVKLDFRTLGRTGLKVTTLGFGCMITSDPSVIERAVDIGINYFDTARSYQHGNNERMVGAALGAKRKQIVLSTKSHSPNKEALLKDLDTSLRELNTDWVDIWYLHAKGSAEEIHDDMIEAQQVAKKQGKIRFAGVSTHGGQQQLLPWLAQKGVFDVVLTAYNFSMDSTMEQEERLAMVFESAGGFSPTIGILGAVLGLIQVMHHLDNMQEVGRGIAVAFVATIYGVGIANLFFLPFAGKMRIRIRDGQQRREMMLEGVISILEGMNPRMLEVQLAGFLNDPQQKQKERAA